MSLEQQLAENTAVLRELLAVLRDRPMQAPSMQPATDALSIAAAAPLPTAPVAEPAGFPAPTTAFAQPAPTAPAPAATVAPPTAAPAAVGERDARGFPWDGRIHANTKSKIADGTWRYKRGVDETVIAQIEAELAATLGMAVPAAAAPVVTAAAVAATAPVAVAPAPAAVPVAGQPWPFPDPNAAPVAAPAAAAVAAPVAPAAPVAAVPPPPVAVAPAAPAAAPAPVAPAATVITTYEQLMAVLPERIVSGTLTAERIHAACNAAGAESAAALQHRPDLVPAVAAALGL